jgi:dolichyl-phosphate beta-glucosyltransferase
LRFESITFDECLLAQEENVDRIEYPFLTIVIPAYNEELRLPDSLLKIANFLRQQTYRSEVLVVENGSTDRTAWMVEEFQANHVKPDDPFEIRLLHSAKGKGAAVKMGMLTGCGQYFFLCDADLSMPIEEIEQFLLPQLLKSYDVIIGSREASGARRYNEPFHRHLLGRVFNLLVHALIIPNIKDTQCGFKCFTHRAVHSIFPCITIDGWGFDIEVLYIAHQRGFRVIEIPIQWYYMENSRLSPLQDSLRMFRELLQVHKKGQAGLYNPHN